MPLLKKEVEVFPANLFDLSLVTRPWGVAHVRSRQEKVLSRHLAENGIPFYLPQAEKRRRQSGRSVASYLPLFAGYVFHRASPAEQSVLWRSNVIANLIDVLDQDALDAELAQLRRLQLAGASLQIYHELFPGDPVRIDDGSFAGYTGVVERGKGQDRLIVRISLLRQNVCVEFDRDILSRLRGTHLPPAG